LIEGDADKRSLCDRFIITFDWQDGASALHSIERNPTPHHQRRAAAHEWRRAAARL
jgi:hypothetical protein